MKKRLLFFTIFTIILGLFIIFNPGKVFAGNGPSDEFCYIVFYDGETSQSVYRPNTVDNKAQAGATYDKKTNTLTLNNLKNEKLTLEINEMGDDFKLKLVGTNLLKQIVCWGFGYGGSLNITGTGSLDVKAGDIPNAIIMYAESAASKLVIDSTATVNLYSSRDVVAVYDTSISSSKEAIKLPNATSTGTNSVKLPSGKTITFEADKYDVEIYDSMKAFRPSEYTSSYTVFTNSKDSQYVYGGIFYSWVSSGSKEYENAWKIWKFVKSGDKYLATGGEWDYSSYEVVEDSKLASSNYTKTGNTFETYYMNGVEDIDIGKDSNGKKYGLYSQYEYNSSLGTSEEVLYAYDIGTSVTVNGEKVYIFTKNTTVDASKLTKTVKEKVPYYNYTLPEKELKIAGSGLEFKDVKEGSWYYNAVKYVYENNIMSGLNATSFGPTNKLTRGMMVTILYKMEGSPKVTNASTFTDVKDNSKYYYKPAVWAASNKIVSGYKDGRFGPSDNITREQLAVILYKYAKYKKKDVSKTNDLSAFSDKGKVASYALDQVKWAVASGVITGSNGKLNPKGNATRAEVAAMMEKYCKRVGR